MTIPLLTICAAIAAFPVSSCAQLPPEDTSLESKSVTLNLDEGTWMSVDVSPDGQTIAFDLLNDINTFPAEGGMAKAVHRGSPAQRSPQFSPDGQSLVYLSDESGADNV